MNATPRDAGALYGVGLGPGDPELVTVKAARIIGDTPVVAYFAKRGREATREKSRGFIFVPPARNCCCPIR